MRSSSLLLLALALPVCGGCSGDAFFYIPPINADAAVEGGDADEPAADANDSDSSPDATKLDAPDGCATQNGQAACDSVENSFCTRTSACCNGQIDCGCTQNPQNWFCSVQNCRTHYAVQGYSCPTYASGSVCTDSSQSCTSNIQSATCQDLLNANCTKPGLSACVPFWGQF